MSDAVVYRFPTGGSEYRLSANRPQVGDVLERHGDRWTVVSVETREDGTTVASLQSEGTVEAHGASFFEQ